MKMEFSSHNNAAPHGKAENQLQGLQWLLYVTQIIKDQHLNESFRS